MEKNKNKRKLKRKNDEKKKRKDTKREGTFEIRKNLKTDRKKKIITFKKVERTGRRKQNGKSKNGIGWMEDGNRNSK